MIPDINLLQKQVHLEFPNVGVCCDSTGIVYISGTTSEEELQAVQAIIAAHNPACGTNRISLRIQAYKAKQLKLLEQEINSSPCAKAFFDGSKAADLETLNLIVKYLIMKSDFIPNWVYKVRGRKHGNH